MSNAMLEHMCENFGQIRIQPVRYGGPGWMAIGVLNWNDDLDPYWDDMTGGDNEWNVADEYFLAHKHVVYIQAAETISEAYRLCMEGLSKRFNSTPPQS